VRLKAARECDALSHEELDTKSFFPQSANHADRKTTQPRAETKFLFLSLLSFLRIGLARLGVAIKCSQPQKKRKRYNFLGYFGTRIQVFRMP
jgi:hypothetical protein